MLRALTLWSRYALGSRSVRQTFHGPRPHVPGGRLCKRQGKVVAIQLESFAEIEPMRRMPCVAGIEVHCIAPKFPRVADEPVEQPCCKPSPSRVFERREVIDVQHLSPCEEFNNAEACGALDSAVVPESQNLKRLRSLTSDLGDELLPVQMRTKDGERLEAGFNVDVSVREKNFRVHGQLE